MKGYAKGYLSDKTKSELQSIVDKADNFISLSYKNDYAIKTKERYMIFFEKERVTYDISMAEDDAINNHCKINMFYSDSYLFFEVMPEVNKYRKILTLASAEVFYLDDELQEVLNDYLEPQV